MLCDSSGAAEVQCSAAIAVMRQRCVLQMAISAAALAHKKLECLQLVSYMPLANANFTATAFRQFLRLFGNFPSLRRTRNRRGALVN